MYGISYLNSSAFGKVRLILRRDRNFNLLSLYSANASSLIFVISTTDAFNNLLIPNNLTKFLTKHPGFFLIKRLSPIQTEPSCPYLSKEIILRHKEKKVQSPHIFHEKTTPLFSFTFSVASIIAAVFCNWDCYFTDRV